MLFLFKSELTSNELYNLLTGKSNVGSIETRFKLIVDSSKGLFQSIFKLLHHIESETN